MRDNEIKIDMSDVKKNLQSRRWNSELNRTQNEKVFIDKKLYEKGQNRLDEKVVKRSNRK